MQALLRTLKSFGRAKGSESEAILRKRERQYHPVETSSSVMKTWSEGGSADLRKKLMIAFGPDEEMPVVLEVIG